MPVVRGGREVPRTFRRQPREMRSQSRPSALLGLGGQACCAYIQGAGGGNFCRRVAPRPGMLPGESSRSRVGARAALAGKCALRGYTLEPQLCGATCAAELGCCCHRRQVRAGAPSPAAPSRRQHCELHVAGADILLRCAAGAAFYLLTALSHPLQGTLRRVRCCLRFRSAARAARRCGCVAGPMMRRRCAR